MTNRSVAPPARTPTSSRGARQLSDRQADAEATPLVKHRLEAPYSGTRAAAVADLHGEGRLDIAAANNLANDVSVALGRGDGGFLSAAHLHAHGGAEAVAVGDLNGDSLPDLAVAIFDTRDISVLFQTTATPPGVDIRAVNRACLKRGRRARVLVTSVTPLISISVFVGGARIKRTTSPQFTLRIPVTRPGRHSLRVTAVNRANLGASKTVHFQRCSRWQSAREPNTVTIARLEDRRRAVNAHRLKQNAAVAVGNAVGVAGLARRLAA